MIDQSLLDKFWKEFRLNIQDEDETYPIANPNDAARTLIKCRNWLGIFTELLIKREYELLVLKKSLKIKQANYNTLRNEYLIELKQNYSLTMLKTKDIQDVLIIERAANDTIYYELKQELQSAEDNIMEVVADKEILEFLLKRIEKSVDWLSQYLNWIKYELRAN